MLLDVLCERLSFSAFHRKTTNFDCIISFLVYISDERSFGKKLHRALLEPFKYILFPDFFQNL